MVDKIKRSLVATYLDVDPPNADYALIGPGAVSGTINMNPQTTTETYIHEDTASISVDSYQPQMPVELTAIQGDDIFEYVDGLRKNRTVLAEAESSIIEVDLYEVGGPTAYPARKQNVSIQVDDFGGDGGAPVKLNFTLNYVGDKILGTFNTGTGAFTASGSAS